MGREELLAALAREDARFAAAVDRARRAAGWRARVPACPGWDLADLTWHLAEVQHVWTWLVATRAPSPAGRPEPVRPADDELPALLAAQARALEGVLAAADPADRFWTWWGHRDPAFALRRQLHEATVHRVDAEQVLGAVGAVPPDVALDGLDEWLEVIVPAGLPGGPPAGSAPVVLVAVDVDAERTLFPGTDDLPVAALTGSAADLLLVAWRRLPLSAVTVDGDPVRAAALLGAVDLR